MKKFTLIWTVALLLAATNVFAQQITREQRRPVATRQQQKVLHANLQHSQKAKAPRLAPEGAISTEDTPEGKLVDGLIASYNGIAYSWLGGFYDSSSEGSVAKIVEGTDGNLYIQGLTPTLYDDDYFWIKAEKGEGENEYIVHKQVAGIYYYYTGDTEEDYVTRLVYDEESGYYNEAENTDIKFTYKDGVLTSAEDAEYGIVYYDTEDEEWAWDGSVYWNFKAEPLTETYAELPEGAVVEDDFVLQSTDGGKKVQVAFVGDKVYVQSYSTVPGWYVGTIDGNKVTFANGQFLGFDSYYGSYEWFTTATVHEEWDEEYEEYYTASTISDNIVFDYDATARTLTAAEDAAMFVNGSKQRIYYAERYIAPRFFPFVEVPAVPADPVISAFWDYDEDYESAELDFSISATDVDGNYINPDKLSYQVYVDDEVFTFEKDEYEDLESDLSELPYGFSDGYWIGTTYLGLFFQPAKNVGLQTIYRGADVENRSNLVLWDIESGETYTAGVKAVPTQQVLSVAAEAYYDLAGRRVQANAKGFVVKTLTLADGSKKTYKVVRK